MTIEEVKQIIDERDRHNYNNFHRFINYLLSDESVYSGYKQLTATTITLIQYELIFKRKYTKGLILDLLKQITYKDEFILASYILLGKNDENRELEKMWIERSKNQAKLKYFTPYVKRSDIEKKVDKVLLKAAKAKNPKKKEKILLKNEKLIDGAIYYNLGMVYLSQDNLKEAVTYFEYAAKENYKEAILWLIDYYKKIDDKDNQRKHLLHLATEGDLETIVKCSKLVDYQNISINKLDELIPYFMHYGTNDDIRLALANSYLRKYEELHVNEFALISYMMYASTNKVDDRTTINRLALTNFYNYKVKDKIDIELASIIKSINRIIEKNQEEAKKKAEEEEKKQQLALEAKIKREKEIEETRIKNAKYPDKKIVLDKDYVDYNFAHPALYRPTKEKESYYIEALAAKEKYQVVESLEKAVNAGHSKAMYALYEFYVDSDPIKAYEYFRKAMAYKHPNATDERYYKIKAIIEEIENNKLEEKKKTNPLLLDEDPEYERGCETKKEYNRRVSLYKKALSLKTVDKIIEALTVASDAGHPKAIYHLMKYYDDKDEEKFKEYFIKAAEADVSPLELDKFVVDFDTIYELMKNGHSYGVERLNEFSNISISEEKLEFIEDYIERFDEVSNERRLGLEFLVKHYSIHNSDKLSIYQKMLDKLNYAKAFSNNDDTTIIRFIDECIRKNDFNDLKQEYVDVLFKEKYQNDINVTLTIFDLLMIKDVRDSFAMPYGYFDAIGLLHALEPSLNKHTRDKVYRKIADYYYHKTLDVLTAASYYDKCRESEKAKKIRDKVRYDQMWENKYNAQSEELMKLYPCAELDKWVNMGSTKAKNIVKCYGTLPRSEVIKDMQERDRLLKMGFTLDEMHSDKGYFEGYKLANKIAKKESEIKKAAQASQKVSSPANERTSPIVKQVLAPISNNVNICLFGKISEDPYNPDYNNHSFVFLPSTTKTEVYRKNKEWSEASYGDMEAYYIDELIINGEKVNSDPFYHHLNLTLAPGVYSFKITIVIKTHFTGYMPSDYALNRTNASDYFINSSVKDTWYKIRKTFTLNNYNINPGINYYISIFSVVCGEWTRFYDNFSGRYEGKERKKIFSDFSLVAKPEASVKKDPKFRHLDSKDFITIEDIGKHEYNPLLRW